MGFCFYRTGQVLFRKGDYGDYFYVVLKGKIALYLTNPLLKKLYHELDTLQ